MTLDGTGSRGNAPIACTWSFENADGSIVWDTATGCRLVKAFTSTGMKYVRLIVRDADGDTDAQRRSFGVADRNRRSRQARAALGATQAGAVVGLGGPASSAERGLVTPRDTAVAAACGARPRTPRRRSA